MAFDSSVVTEDWRSVIVPLCKGKGRYVRIIEVLACQV